MVSPLDVTLEAAQALGPQATQAGPTARAQDVQSFNDKMTQAAQKVELPADSAGFVMRLPASFGARAALPETINHGSVLAGTIDRYTRSSQKFQTYQQELSQFGKDLDLSDPASAIMIVEHQARMSASMLEFQFVVQTADNVKHAVTTLFRTQN